MHVGNPAIGGYTQRPGVEGRRWRERKDLEGVQRRRVVGSDALCCPATPLPPTFRVPRVELERTRDNPAYHQSGLAAIGNR